MSYYAHLSSNLFYLYIFHEKLYIIIPKITYKLKLFLLVARLLLLIFFYNLKLRIIMIIISHVHQRFQESLYRIIINRISEIHS